MDLTDGVGHNTPETIQNLILNKNRHLQKLKEQQAKFGAIAPPHILIEIEDLEAELAQLETALNNLRQGYYPWCALLIEADQYWREIIEEYINQFGGAAQEYPASPNQPEIQTDGCKLAIVSPTFPEDSIYSSNQWVENVVQLGQILPIILLPSWEERKMAVTLRQAMRRLDPPVKVTTIYKESFDPNWFLKIVTHALTPGDPVQ